MPLPCLQIYLRPYVTLVFDFLTAQSWSVHALALWTLVPVGIKIGSFIVKICSQVWQQTNKAYRCTDGHASNTKPRSTWLIVLRQPRTSPVDSDYALPVVTNFLCRVTNSAHLAVGLSLSLDQWLGIRCRLTSVIRRVVTSLSDVHWKHSCSLSTSVSSALEVFLRRCAI